MPMNLYLSIQKPMRLTSMCIKSTLRFVPGTESPREFIPIPARVPRPPGPMQSLPLGKTRICYHGNMIGGGARCPTYLPLMTPSGLSMGMILKMKFSLKSLATGSSLTRNSKVPFITQLALLSPGWTRAVITWYGRCPVDKDKGTWNLNLHPGNLQGATWRRTPDYREVWKRLIVADRYLTYIYSCSICPYGLQDSRVQS